MIAGTKGKLTSSSFPTTVFSFLVFFLCKSFYFQHLYPNPLCVFHSRSFLLQAHTLSLSLSPLTLRPPRLPSLCAPAVPLLWLEFVLLCFRMATIEAAPTATHPILSPLLRSSPHPFPLSAHALKELERDGFCVQCRCSGWVKRGAEAVAAYCWGGRLFSLGSPTCGRS